MLELRIRACHVTGEFAASDNRRAACSGLNRIAGPPRFQYGRLAHPPVTFVQERLKVEERLPAARAFIRERQAQRDAARRPRRYRHHRDGRAHQLRAARARAARPRRPVRRRAASRSTCSTWSIRWCRRRCASSAPASARCWWSRKAIPTTSSRRSTWSCAAPTSRPGCSARARCRRPANTPPTSCSTASPPSSPRCARTGVDADAIGARAQEHAGAPAGRRRRRRRPAAAAADLLHRLPGAAGVRRHQARAARDRADPYQRRYRLPFVRDLRAVQPRQLDPRLRHEPRQRGGGRAEPGKAPDRRDGRRRLLAQRADHRRRLEPVQQGRRRADRHAERLHLGDRPAIHAVEQDEPHRRAAPAWTSRRRCARWASRGCARCAPTASPRW